MKLVTQSQLKQLFDLSPSLRLYGPATNARNKQVESLNGVTPDKVTDQVFYAGSKRYWLYQNLTEAVVPLKCGN